MLNHCCIAKTNTINRLNFLKNKSIAIYFDFVVAFLVKSMLSVFRGCASQSTPYFPVVLFYLFSVVCFPIRTKIL